MNDIKAFSVNGAAGNTYVWKLTDPDHTLHGLGSTGSSSGNITFSSTGTYILWVQATNTYGCLSEPLTKNIVVRTEATVTASKANASETAGNNGQFTVDLGSVNTTGSNVVITYTVSGSATAGADYAALSGTVVIPNGSHTAVVDVTGIVDDALVEGNETIVLTLTGSNSALFPVSANLALATATVTISDNDSSVVPTVNLLTTNDTTPLLSGTATVGPTETLRVTVNGVTYTAGDGKLTHSGTNWTLQIPAGSELADGTYPVTATVTDGAGNAVSDATTNELVIDTIAPVIPTVENLVTSDTTPLLKGTATVGSGEILKVAVNGITYQQGDGNLAVTGNVWALQVPATSPIPDGTYPVTATVTDAASNTSVDATTGELIIDTKSPVVPTVVSQVTADTTPVITGTATVGAGETLTVTVNGVTYTAGDGKLSVTGNTWSLQVPEANALPDGVYQVVAKVTDAAGNSSTDTTSNELVVGTNKAPVLTNDLATTTTTKPVSGNLLTNDSDPEGTPLTLKVTPVSGPKNGTIVLKADGSFTYTPNTGFTGQDEITYEACDKGNPPACAQAKLVVTVDKETPVPADRLATNDVNVTFKNIPVSGNVLTNDAGYYEAHSAVGMYLDPVNGSVSMATNGVYTYTPKTDFVGIDNFYYTVCTTDEPADCDTVNVTIRVLQDNLSQIPPVANDDEMQTPAGTPVSGNVLSNDLSVSGEKLLLNTKPKDGPKSGKLVLNAEGSFVYTPNAGFTGQDYFVYEVCGSVSGLCSQARVTITVLPDVPEMRLFADDDVFFSYGKTVSGNLLANDHYPSATALKVNRTPLVKSAQGTVSINSDGTFSYTPVAGFVGTDQFVYQICDTQINECDNATVYIVVKEAPATYADLSILKTGPASVVPGETITYQLTVANLGTALASKVEISDYLPSAILNPKYQLAGSTVSKDWSGFYELASLDVGKSFSLSVSGTVAANAADTLKNLGMVTSTTWDPVMSNNISEVKTVVHRGPIARIAGAPYRAVGSCNTKGITLDASKSGGEGLTFSWSPSAYLDNASGATPVFRPGVTTRYKLTVTDNQGRKDTTSLLVVVPAAPMAVVEHNVFVGTPNATIMLDGSKSTGAGLSFLWTSKEGILLSGETTPKPQVSGLGMYYLQVTDSLGCMSRDSVNVGLYIQAINDTTQTNVNESVVINVVKNDIPQKALNPSSISIVTPPLHGMAEVSADSLILYTPEESYIGQDEFVYAICDYFKNCDQAKVLVLINDIPFFVPEAFSPNGDGINDTFEIKGLSKYKTVEIEIINRWGNVVYRSKNYGVGNGKDGFWDGRAKEGVRIGSGPVPTGTYFYILKLNGNQNIQGSIYLDR